MTPKGKCKKCGKGYVGWALEHGDYFCDCGGNIAIDDHPPPEELPNYDFKQAIF